MRLFNVVLLLAMLASYCSCSAGSSGEEPIPGWPPEQPRRPGRLQPVAPAEQDPLLWWSRNILSLVPADVYQNRYYSQRCMEVLTATNQRRAAYGLAPVKPLASLNRVAQAHAMDQAIRDYWSHSTPEGLSSHQRIAAAGAGTVSVGGENSAISVHGHGDGERIVLSFEHHAGHRELLLDPDVRYIGVGIYDFGPGENEHIVQLLVDFAVGS